MSSLCFECGHTEEEVQRDSQENGVLIESGETYNGQEI